MPVPPAWTLTPTLTTRARAAPAATAFRRRALKWPGFSLRGLGLGALCRSVISSPLGCFGGSVRASGPPVAPLRPGGHARREVRRVARRKKAKSPVPPLLPKGGRGTIQRVQRRTCGPSHWLRPPQAALCGPALSSCAGFAIGSPTGPATRRNGPGVKRFAAGTIAPAVTNNEHNVPFGGHWIRTVRRLVPAVVEQPHEGRAPPPPSRRWWCSRWSGEPVARGRARSAGCGPPVRRWLHGNSWQRSGVAITGRTRRTCSTNAGHRPSRQGPVTGEGRGRPLRYLRA